MRPVLRREWDWLEILLAVVVTGLYVGIVGLRVKLRLLSGAELADYWGVRRGLVLSPPGMRVLSAVVFGAGLWMVGVGVGRRFSRMAAMIVCLAVMVTPVFDWADFAGWRSLGMLGLGVAACVWGWRGSGGGRAERRGWVMSLAGFMVVVVVARGALGGRAILGQKFAFAGLRDAVERGAGPGEVVWVEDARLLAELRWYGSAGLQEQMRYAGDTAGAGPLWPAAPLASGADEVMVVGSADGAIVRGLRERGWTLTEVETPSQRLRFGVGLTPMMAAETRVFLAVPGASR